MKFILITLSLLFVTNLYSNEINFKCQNIIKQKMIEGIDLFDTDKAYDDDNSIVNDAIKFGKKTKTDSYRINANNNNLVESFSLVVNTEFGDNSVKKVVELYYSEYKLYLDIDAELDRGLGYSSINQVYFVDDNCSLKFLTQEITRIDPYKEIFKVENFVYANRTDELEKRVSEIDRFPDELEIENNNVFKMLKNTNLKSTEVFINMDDPNFPIDVALTGSYESEQFDKNLNKVVPFKIKTAEVISRNTGIVTYFVIKESTKSSFSIGSDTIAGLALYYNVKLDVWMKESITVFSEVNLQEVIGFNEGDFEQSLALTLTSQSIIEMINESEYYESVERYNDDLEFSLNLVTKDNLLLIGTALLSDEVLEEDQKYLMPTEFYQLDNPVIIELANRLKERKYENRLMLMEAILREVNSLIVYDFYMLENPENRRLNTSQIINRKAGVCHHFANLATTLARKMGIPTRSVLGLSINDSMIVHHAWIEAKISNDRWTPIEPQDTYVGGLYDSVYVPLSEHVIYENNGESYVDYMQKLKTFISTLKVEKM